MANIIRWNPVREMAAMQNIMDRLMDDTLRSVRPFAEFDGAALALDVHEDGTNYLVTTSLPGVDADNIKINLNDNVLTIDAEIPEKKVEREGVKTLIQERTYGKFTRTIRLPQAVNTDKVEAQYQDGVLTLTLPKADHVLPRSIPVKRLTSNNS